MPKKRKDSSVPRAVPQRRKTGKSALPAAGETGARLPPGLYLVATPIGHAQDITLRALETLRDADVLFCEDTRRTQKLLALHGIKGKKRIAAHAHNEKAAAEVLAARIKKGQAVAYVSDAGLPLISDPGQAMVARLAQEGLPVTSLPGANAALTALQLAALPPLPFYFVGFLPPKSGARRRALERLKNLEATLLFFEAPHRIRDALEDMRATLGNRQACVARELTKRHEEVRRGGLAELAGSLGEKTPRGEMVVVVAPPAGGNEDETDRAEIDRLLLDARKNLSARDAAAIMSGKTGLPKRELYQRLLHLRAPGKK